MKIAIYNVDNTSDLDKPISTAQQTALDLKANQDGKLRKAAPSTRGPEWTNPWCLGCHANGIAQ